MKPKNIVSAILLLFVVVSVVYLVAGESTSRKGASEASAGNAGAPALPAKPQDQRAETATGAGAPAHRVVAYYFHGDFRCRTCLAMERYAREALEEGLADELESGALEWRAVNYDLPENEHFTQDYGLTSSAVVLVNMIDNKQQEWKDLQQIWDLVGDEGGFKDYVRNEAVAYLENE